MTARPFLPQVFSILAALIEERTGIHYGQGDAAIAWEKLSLRSEEAGFDSLLDYYYFLRYDDAAGDELRALVDTIVVRETYFFREQTSLRALVDEVIVPSVKERGTARVWSAACATGEEPLTIAMMLADREVLDRVEILASDISDRSIERARAGRFSLRALRAIRESGGAGRWIREEPSGPVVDSSIFDRVRWFRQNLLDEEAIARMPPQDAIVCRNVLIYFAEATVLRVVRTLAAALRPGGVLLVGVSESLLRLDTSLTCEERGGAFLYRKPAS